MNMEKFVNSKFYSVCEWLWQLVMLNFMTLVTSLGVITIIPAFTACMQSFKDFKEGSEDNVFKTYFSNFGRHFKKSFGFSIFFVGLLALNTYAFATYFMNAGAEDAPASMMAFYQIGMCISALFEFIILLVQIQIPLVTVYFDFKFGQALKNAFYMSFRYLLTSFVGLMSIAMSIIIFLYGTILWFFIGIALPLYLIYIVSQKKYLYLSLNVYDIKDVDNLEYEREEEK